ncbi:MAG: stage V sporulation protein AC [Bacillota bacterium]|jgi:stage V sporulation protein AC|nr:stage V sporulation protein AC [Bacillota bacterium]HOP53175.1 stage V sporulation protein AC [Bacillota bacterium]HPT60474.1 stage V sporulation protein AC [Bacillota bacterium]
MLRERESPQAKRYARLVEQEKPRVDVGGNVLKAFVVGGTICLIGEVIKTYLISFGLSGEVAGVWTSIALVFLSALLTGLGIYDEIARFGGAGSAIPITGFSNSVVAPAMEFRSEGAILGLAARMFVIAGPVIVYGLVSATVFGLIRSVLF